MTWRAVDLANQFRRAAALDWIPIFEDEAVKTDFDPEILIAISSRETNLRNIIGDNKHGYGLMQIDNRSFPVWCSSGVWKDAKKAIAKGASVLYAKRDRVRWKHVPTDDELRVAIAAYNAGDHPIEDYFKHSDPDRRTTGHDYSADVLKRAECFKKLLHK